MQELYQKKLEHRFLLQDDSFPHLESGKDKRKFLFSIKAGKAEWLNYVLLDETKLIGSMRLIMKYTK